VEPRSCEMCGGLFIASRASARFCGATCRKRHSRGGEVRPAARPESAPAIAAGPAESIEAATRAELDAAGRATTSEGQKALLLARRLDDGVRDTGMGLAAVMRAHSAALAEAVKGAAVAADPVDELRARRDQKRVG
jgi:hypothetical protein